MAATRNRTPGFDPADETHALPAVVAANEKRVRRSFWKKLVRVAGSIPFAEDAVAAYFCAMDTSTPVRVRGTLLAALAYFVVPIDVIPDFLAGLGYADDASVLALALSLVASHLKPEHREAARKALLFSPNGPAPASPPPEQ